MNNFSDYIVYVDESGDHGLENISQTFPVFCLAFCIFNKEEYTKQIVPSFQQFKFKYWGHDAVILHERDIRKNNKGDYALLNDAVIRSKFHHDISALIEKSPFFVAASVIRKDLLAHKGTSKNNMPNNPYELAMLFCMEQLLLFLCENGQLGKSIHVLFESRGKEEDAELELEFQRICNNSAQFQNLDFSQVHLTMRFVNKKANSSGLQIADLVARPLALSVLRPEQENRALAIIKSKLL